MKGLFRWFDSSEAEAFARELAAFMVEDLRGENLDSLQGKSRKRAERTMLKAGRRIQDFRAKRRLNFYTKSKAANAFLWQLKEAGWPPAYATQMTEWLTLRL